MNNAWLPTLPDEKQNPDGIGRANAIRPPTSRCSFSSLSDWKSFRVQIRGGQHGTLRPLGPPTSMACCTLLCCPPVLTQLLWDFKTHRETCAEDRSGPAVVLLDGTEIGRSLIVGKTLFLSITCRSLPVWEGNWRLWSEIRSNWRERNRVSPVTEWLNLGSSSKSRFVINVKC